MDLVTLAMNMVCHGVESGLDFSRIMKVSGELRALTGMKVDERTPYAGDLVFTAFSGSHQDAISRVWPGGMREKAEVNGRFPYLPVDPKDVGREYESDVIRINSQSGKGGIAFILKQNFGFSLPDGMKEEVGYLVKGVSDKRHQELAPADIYQIFKENYISPRTVFQIPEFHFRQENGITAQVTIEQGKERRVVEASGNGRLDSVSNAVKMYFGIDYELAVYEEHAISRGLPPKQRPMWGFPARARCIGAWELMRILLKFCGCACISGQ